MSDAMGDALRLARALQEAEARGFARGWRAHAARVRAVLGEAPAEEAEVPPQGADGIGWAGVAPTGANPPRKAGGSAPEMASVGTPADGSAPVPREALAPPAAKAGAAMREEESPPGRPPAPPGVPVWARPTAETVQWQRIMDEAVGLPAEGRKRRRGDWITDARDVVLRRDVPAGVAWPAIMERLRLASPDAPLPLTVKALRVRAVRDLGLRRPGTELSRARVAQLQAGLAAKKAAAGAAPVRPVLERQADVAAEAPWPIPPAPKAPELPPPDPVSGKVYATFAQVRAWAGFYGIAYDGGNMDRVNKLRAAKGLAPLVQVEAAAA